MKKSIHCMFFHMAAKLGFSSQGKNTGESTQKKVIMKIYESKEVARDGEKYITIFITCNIYRILLRRSKQAMGETSSTVR
jgi:hypothetical protein